MIHELSILKKLLPELLQDDSVVIGPGDDCAAVHAGDGKLLLAAVDQLVGDIHYYKDSTPPHAAGAKLLKRNLSDIAAMGGVPRWALLTLAVNGRGEKWILDFCRGVNDAARQYQVPVIGGDLCSTKVEDEVSTLTILGEVDAGEVIRRSGAQAGDLLYVSASLGNSLASGHHLEFSPRLPEGRFLARHHLASAMLDVSDGLLLDARRLAEASKVDLAIDPEALPLRSGASVATALSDGEDYELLFTVPAEKVSKLTAEWPFLTPISCIGQVRPGAGRVTDINNQTLAYGKSGYEH